MRSYVDRRNMIENLMNLVQQMKLEPEEAVKMETELLKAYALVQIEKHLADYRLKLDDGQLKELRTAWLTAIGELPVREYKPETDPLALLFG